MAKEKAASLLGPRPQIKNNTLSTAFRRSRRVTALQGVDGSCSKGGCMQAWVGYVTTKQSSTWGLLGGEEQGTCIISNLDIS